MRIVFRITANGSWLGDVLEFEIRPPEQMHNRITNV